MHDLFHCEESSLLELFCILKVSCPFLSLVSSTTLVNVVLDRTYADCVRVTAMAIQVVKETWSAFRGVVTVQYKAVRERVARGIYSTRMFVLQLKSLHQHLHRPRLTIWTPLSSMTMGVVILALVQHARVHVVLTATVKLNLYAFSVRDLKVYLDVSLAEAEMWGMQIIVTKSSPTECRRMSPATWQRERMVSCCQQVYQQGSLPKLGVKYLTQMAEDQNPTFTLIQMRVLFLSTHRDQIQEGEFSLQ